jgi:hypothetical protein
MMNLLNRAVCGAMFLALAQAAHAGPIEDLSASLQGRTGTASEDHRQEGVVLRVFGRDVKGGCKGDVRAAKVKITAATGHLTGDTAAMDVAYDGAYEKTSCGGDAGAPETKHLSGHYLFHVTSRPFQKLSIAPGDLAPGFGEVADRDDISNRLAVDAVKAAVASAF